MRREEAKEILLLYRPWSAKRSESQMREALELAKRDPELGRWLAQHVAFQEAVRAKLKAIEVRHIWSDRIK